MTDTDKAESRRERVKLAQRAYRKRHASKVQRLEVENSKLKAVLSELDTALQRHGIIAKDVDILLRKAREISVGSNGESASGKGEGRAQEVTDAEPPATEGFDPSLPVAGPECGSWAESGTFESSSLIEQEQITDQDEEMYDQSLFITDGHFTPTFPLAKDALATTSPSAPFLTRNEGRISPWFDYGLLWQDEGRLVRAFDTPSEMMPYLGPGMRTLAGCVFWACVTRTVAIWETTVGERHRRHGSTVSSSDGSSSASSHASCVAYADALVAARTLEKLFSHSDQIRALLLTLRNVKTDFEDMAAKSATLRSVTSSDKSENRRAASDDGAEAWIRLTAKHKHRNWRQGCDGDGSLVVGDHQGRSPAWWKGPEEVAALVERQLRAETAERFRAVIEGRGGLDNDARMLGEMVLYLAHTFVCFGQGPKWDVVTLSMGIGSWMKRWGEVPVSQT